MRLPPAAKSAEPSLAASDSLGEVAYKVFHNAAARALKFAEMLAQSELLMELVEFDRGGALH